MLWSRFLLLVFLLIGTQSWGIRPSRFRDILDDGEEELLDGQLEDVKKDFTRVKSKDTNPYVKTYRSILTDVGNVFTEQKIPWHISFGTLIGQQRNQKFIPYDGDVDIYVDGQPFDNPETFQKIQTAVTDLDKGYIFGKVRKGSKVHRVTLDTKGKTLDFRHRGPNGEGTWVDLYSYHDCENDKKINKGQDSGQDSGPSCAGFEVPEGARLKMNELLPAKPCKMDNVDTMCPHNPDYLLKTYYGGDWKTPKLQYCDGEWKTDCPESAGLKPADIAHKTRQMKLARTHQNQKKTKKHQKQIKLK